MTRTYHDPVMVREVVAHLGAESGGLYFDGTLGGGGHTEAILEAGADTRVLAVDQDPDALATAGKRLERYGARVQLVESNFADAAEQLEEPLAGALLDLGISSHQIDMETRGFSFRPGTPLDMRMAAGASVATAAGLLNELDGRELADVFYRDGEERRSRRLAGEVVRRRRTRPFRTSDDLLAAIDAALGARTTNQDRARIFQ